MKICPLNDVGDDDNGHNYDDEDDDNGNGHVLILWSLQFGRVTANSAASCSPYAPTVLQGIVIVYLHCLCPHCICVFVSIYLHCICVNLFCVWLFLRICIFVY